MRPFKHDGRSFRLLLAALLCTSLVPNRLLAGDKDTGMLMVRWVSKSNNDSIFGGIDSINNGKFKGFHDNLQQSNVTWTHRFNETGTFLTTTEAYYIYQSHALIGGTVNFGPPHTWFAGVGAGAPIAGNSPAIGFVNYTEWRFSKKDFLSIRPLDILDDQKGERTGFPYLRELDRRSHSSF